MATKIKPVPVTVPNVATLDNISTNAKLLFNKTVQGKLLIFYRSAMLSTGTDKLAKRGVKNYNTTHNTQMLKDTLSQVILKLVTMRLYSKLGKTTT